MSVRRVRQTVQGLLPSPMPVRFVAEDGTPVSRPPADYTEPAGRGACARRTGGWSWAGGSTRQATALTKQGRLAVYPSSRGQEACQIGAVLALRERRLAVPHLPRHRGRWSPAASTPSRC